MTSHSPAVKMETPPSSPSRGVPSQPSSKRKRDHQPSTPVKQQRLTPTKSNDARRSITPDDLSPKGSPRSKVTRQFQGLRLSAADFEGSKSESGLQDRHGFFNASISANPASPDTDKLVPESKGEGLAITRLAEGEQIGSTQSSLEATEKEPLFEFMGDQAGDEAKGASGEGEGSAPLKENQDGNIESERKVVMVLPSRAKEPPASNASITQTSGSKPQAISKVRPKPTRRRSGTPPPSQLSSSERPVIDHERASQTWQESEITGFTISDPDDDGEGINGIGFRPTAAMAHARAEKRRAQVLEYKNREAREARAKRSERRREGLSRRATDEILGESASRKVRFEAAQGKDD